MSNHLTEVEIKDFQSLKHVKVPLGRFTAVVGPSNTGKSAIVRALRALARNGSSSGLVRDGAASFKVKAKFDDYHAATIERGPRTSKMDLQIPKSDGADVVSFAKLGTAIPEQAAEVWSLADSELGDLTFSTQHDSPFMLGVPASAVAKAIGELTNASVLMEAVREANRRRNEAVADAKARKREYDEATAEIENFIDLDAEEQTLKAATVAVEHYEKAVALTRGLTDLVAVTHTTTQAMNASLKAAKQAALVTTAAERVSLLRASYESLSTIQSNHLSLVNAANSHEAQAAAKHEDAETYRQQAHEALRQAGHCPVCGKAV